MENLLSQEETTVVWLNLTLSVLRESFYLFRCLHSFVWSCIGLLPLILSALSLIYVHCVNEIIAFPLIKYTEILNAAQLLFFFNSSSILFKLPENHPVAKHFSSSLFTPFLSLASRSQKNTTWRVRWGWSGSGGFWETLAWDGRAEPSHREVGVTRLPLFIY